MTWHCLIQVTFGVMASLVPLEVKVMELPAVVVVAELPCTLCMTTSTEGMQGRMAEEVQVRVTSGALVLSSWKTC